MKNAKRYNEPLFMRAERLRILFHELMSDPAKEYLVWQKAPKLRSFFAKHWHGDSFVSGFDDNIRFWINLSDHIESQVYFHNMQEGDRGQIRLLKKFWKPGITFLDIGANVGVYTVMAAKRLGHNSVIHAFEPVQRLYQRMTSNLILNAYDHVITHPVAISSSTGSASIWIPKHNNLGMSSLHPSTPNLEEEHIHTITLDDWVKKIGITSIDIIKMDIEGHEMQALVGAESTLTNMQPVITIELSREHLKRANSTPEEVTAFLKNYSYTPYGISDEGIPFEKPIWKDHQNALFIPHKYSLAKIISQV